MNTNYIAFLLEVSHCGSINRAAQNLRMPQPQVSHIIRSVEEELGFQLFQRSSAGVTLTTPGRQVMESLRIVSGELGKIRAIPTQQKERRDISVAAIYSRFLFQAFLDFQRRRPGQGEPDCFTEDIYDTVIEKVISQKVRLGIVSRALSLPGSLSNQLERYGLEIIQLYSGLPMLAFLGRNHPLARRDFLTVQDIQSHPFAYFHGTDEGFLAQLFPDAAVVPALLVNDRASLSEAIASCRYLSISNTASEKVSWSGNYVYLPIQGVDRRSEICCIKLRSYKITSRERQFLAYIRRSLICSYSPPPDGPSV